MYVMGSKQNNSATKTIHPVCCYRYHISGSFCLSQSFVTEEGDNYK